MVKKGKSAGRARRKQRVRKKIRGTADRPRLSVFRSLRHIYAQAIDDDAGRTVASASSMVVTEIGGLNKSEVAHAVGKLLAKSCQAASVTQVVFDRNGYLYNGRVAAVAEGAREAGLEL